MLFPEVQCMHNCKMFCPCVCVCLYVGNLHHSGHMEVFDPSRIFIKMRSSNTNQYMQQRVRLHHSKEKKKSVTSKPCESCLPCSQWFFSLSHYATWAQIVKPRFPAHHVIYQKSSFGILSFRCWNKEIALYSKNKVWQWSARYSTI